MNGVGLCQLGLLAGLAGCGGGVTPSPPRPDFEFFPPTDGQGCSVAMWVNDAGAVVGFSDACSDTAWPNTHRAYPYAADADGMRRLFMPDPESTVYAYAISDDGHIIANSYKTSTSQYAQYVYRPGAWDAPETLPFPNEGDAVAITGRRTGGGRPLIVGGAGTGTGANRWQWFRYDVAAAGQTGQTTFIPPPAAGFDGDGGALAVNNRGDMAGFYTLTGGTRTAMAWTEERGLQDLNTLLPSGNGWTLPMALGISDRRQVIGFGNHGADHHAFRLDLEAATITDLGTLPTTSAALNATGINSKGHVVGTAGDVADAIGYHLYAQRAFFYSDESGIKDLNDVVDVPDGWILVDATAINDSDEVVGFARSADVPRRAYRAKVKLP